MFPATLTPCFSYDPIRLEGPIKKPDIGIIFCNGVNFETKDTADFKKFNNDLVQLEKHIRKIAHCIVQAAYQLTKKANKTICNLKIPKIGLGQFAKKYQNKKALILCYLHNIQIALYSNSKKNIK